MNRSLEGLDALTPAFSGICLLAATALPVAAQEATFALTSGDVGAPSCVTTPGRSFKQIIKRGQLPATIRDADVW